MANEQKNPLALRLPQYVRHEIRNWVARNGKAMPGHVKSVSGVIVTINFDVTDLVLPPVTMPVIGAEYIRLPIQEGDKGGCLPFDFYMGGVSGLGSAPTADSSPQGNLAALTWVPVGSKSWVAVDPNAVTVYGPNGVVLRDTGSDSVATLTPADIDLDTSVVSTTGNLVAGTGASGTFTTPTGQTVTVQDGIIVNIF
jgi:hypothetical protein